MPASQGEEEKILSQNRAKIQFSLKRYPFFRFHSQFDCYCCYSFPVDFVFITEIFFGRLRDDMVYDELLKLAEEESAKTLPLDEDLPGMGQFYCLHCE